MKTLAPIVLFSLAGSIALAQTPTPVATATPVASVTPTATATPAETATPIATPAATATPDLAPTPPPPPPEPTPAATPEGTIEVHHARNWRGGMPHRPKGIRPVRGLAAIGGHVFFGDGWNRDSDLPGEDPPKSLDYGGGAMRLGLLYELNPNIAVGAVAGGHQGSHVLDETPGLAPPVTVAYGLYYSGVTARWQSTPGPAGMYLELGAGAGAGRVVVTHPNAFEDEDEDELTPTVVGFGAIGGTGNVGQGVDVFFELRYMTAPDAADSFTSDDDLDLGGLTATTGILLRL